MIGVVIPTRFNPPTLAPMLALIEEEGIPVILQQSEDFNHQLHRMWNDGVDRLRAMGCDEIAILNDDITIAHGTLYALARALRDNENAAISQPIRPLNAQRVKPHVPTQLMYRGWEKEYVGHCFMIKAELPLPRFDESYHLFQGDIVFFDSVIKMGYDIVTVRKLTVGHLRSFSVDRVRENNPELVEDVVRFHGANSKHADYWTGRQQTRLAIARKDQPTLNAMTATFGRE